MQQQLLTYLLLKLFHKLLKAFVAGKHLAEFVLGLCDNIIYSIKIRFGIHFEDFYLIVVHLASQQGAYFSPTGRLI